MSRKTKAQAEPSAPAIVITRDTLVADAVNSAEGAKDVLMGYGLPCFRCEVAFHESLAEGCAPLGLAVEEIVLKLNALLQPEGGSPESRKA